MVFKRHVVSSVFDAKNNAAVATNCANSEKDNIYDNGFVMSNYEKNKMKKKNPLGKCAIQEIS